MQITPVLKKRLKKAKDKHDAEPLTANNANFGFDGVHPPTDSPLPFYQHYFPRISDHSNSPKPAPVTLSFPMESPLDLCTTHQPKQLRGFIPNYQAQLPVEQLTSNTLTGFLINLIQQTAGCALDHIIEQTLPYFMQFRKLDGKPYTAGSARRSIISALSANGIFGTHGKKEDRVFFVN
jgi:hypothetical protein